jgi:cytoskeletal protein RodZ
MRCPKCKTDVPDGHSYCTQCRTLLYDYAPEDAAPTETAVSRAGKRLFDLLILVVLIAGGVVLGRAIQWKQILTGFKPAAVSPSPRQGKSQTNASAKHSAARSSSQASQEKSEEPSKPASAESKSEKPESPVPADEIRPATKPDLTKKKDGQ